MNQKAGKKVLFIAYLYPPIANSGTRRSLEFANHLADNGWEPIVLTVADPPAKYCEPSLIEEVRPGTRIERAPLWSDVAARRIADALGALIDRNRVAEGLRWRIRNLWQVPDECATWLPAAVRRSEEIYRRDGFHAIYASGWPWTSFLIAREVSRRTRKPYILDYRDLWKPSGTMEWETQTPLQKLFGPGLERKVLSGASAVISVTPSLVKTLEKSKGKGKVVCITNGFDPASFAHASSRNVDEQDHVVRVVYIGVWRPGYGLDDLYQAVRLLREGPSKCRLSLRVTVAGFPPGPARQYGVEDIVEELGPVPHRKAIDLMVHATALYLPVPTGLYAKASLPGKMFEYLGSGRPIIASVPSDSEAAALLASAGGALCVPPGDVQALAQLLWRMCNGDTIVFPDRVPDVVAQYTRSSLSKKLAAVLDSVVQKPG
jgi:glycosyltransferase involved in cell wall biosynthesis